MNISLLLLSLASAFQPLSRRDLKDFRESFSLLAEAHSKGHDEIVGKYGPELLERYDLIQVSRKEDAPERIAYDSLKSWVSRYQDGQNALRALQGLEALGTTEKARKLSSTEDVIASTQDRGTKSSLEASTLAAMRALLRDPIDSLWKVQSILPDRLTKAVGFDRILQEGLDAAFTQATNDGREGLICFSMRFPGYRQDEVQTSLDFIQIDEMNVALRSERPQELIPIYKSLPEGKQKNKLRLKLEKIMYVRWKRAKILDEEIKAAQDLVELFKDERKPTAVYDEVKSWLYYNTLPAPPPAVASPSPTSLVPAGSPIPTTMTPQEQFAAAQNTGLPPQAAPSPTTPSVAASEADDLPIIDAYGDTLFTSGRAAEQAALAKGRKGR